MTTATPPNSRPPAVRRHNRRMLVGLSVFVVLMAGFGYAMVPMYKSICEALGVNVIARDDGDGQVDAGAANSQVDLARSVTVEFDANVRGPWEFHPEQSSVVVHPGALTTVMYEFKNTQSRTMTAQAIPSYAPGAAQPHFNKVQCFCFTQHTLAPGESKRWPVTFFVDDKLPKDIKTITLSYSFFEIGGTMPAAPSDDAARPATPQPHA